MCTLVKLKILSYPNFFDKVFLYIYITINFLLSLRVFGLLSSSLLFPQCFGRYVLRPSSGACQTREPSQNFELHPLLNPRRLPVLIPLAITGYKYSCTVTRLQSELNLQPPDDFLLRTNAYNHYAMCPAGQFRVNFWDL